MRGARPSGCRLRRSTLTGGCSRAGVGAADQPADGGVGGNQRPVPVDGQRRVGLVPASTRSTALRAACSAGSSSVRSANTGAIARGHQQHVALAQGDLELLGQVQHHLAAGLRAAGLEEAQVPGRDLGLEARGRAGSCAGAGAIRAAVAHGLGSGDRDHGRSLSWAARRPLPRR